VSQNNQTNAATCSEEIGKAPVRIGDKFRCEDGIWEVLYTEIGKVTVQCRALHMQATYPIREVSGWERVS
jgi:hypothetical protein